MNLVRWKNRFRKFSSSSSQVSLVPLGKTKNEFLALPTSYIEKKPQSLMILRYATWTVVLASLMELAKVFIWVLHYSSIIKGVLLNGQHRFLISNDIGWAGWNPWVTCPLLVLPKYPKVHLGGGGDGWCFAILASTMNLSCLTPFQFASTVLSIFGSWLMVHNLSCCA